MAEPKTTDQLYQKMIDCFNLVLSDTQRIRNQNINLRDHLEPTYINVRNLHSMVSELQDEVKRLKGEVYSLERKVEKLNR